jgi:two-component system, CAI-1 autoinducer sensor kinase/phosphatase CqsS
MTKKIVTVRRLSSNKEAQNIATLSGSIAHELKNYLMAINICAELSEDKLRNIKERVKAANYLINNLQLQIRGIIAGEPEIRDFRRYSIIRNIKEALKQYPFEADERELVTVETTRDFEYIGNPILTNHILYNLIKNSLHAIKNTDKGKITMKLEPSTKFNKLTFKDTATGISKKFLPKMFQLFASQMVSQGGTGIGLAFCKTIMESYGGDITCDSAKGKYTEFTLKFPRVE